MSTPPAPGPDAAVVSDLGYRTYDGPRGGRPSAIRALVRQGVRRGLGLGRRARAKVLPFGLLAYTLIVSGVVLVLVWAASQLPMTDFAVDLPGASEVFGLTARPAQLMAALVAAELVVPDRVHGVLRVIAARPLTRLDYALGRAAALAILLAVVLIAPQLLLAVGTSILHPEGVRAGIAVAADPLARSLVASLVAICAWGGIAMCVAAVVRRPSLAIGATLGVLLLSTPLLRGLAGSDLPAAEVLSLLAVEHHPRAVSDALFDSVGTDVLVTYPVAVLAAICVAVVAGAVALLARAVRSAT